MKGEVVRSMVSQPILSVFAIQVLLEVILKKSVESHTVQVSPVLFKVVHPMKFVLTTQSKLFPLSRCVVAQVVHYPVV